MAGLYQVRRPESKADGGRTNSPFVYLRPRLGLYSDQNLDVASIENTPAGTQFETVLQKASSIALSLDTPIVFSRTGADFIIQPNGALSYTRVDPFIFPRIQVGNERRSADSVFEEDAIKRRERRVQRYEAAR